MWADPSAPRKFRRIRSARRRDRSDAVGESKPERRESQVRGQYQVSAHEQVGRRHGVRLASLTRDGVFAPTTGCTMLFPREFRVVARRLAVVPPLSALAVEPTASSNGAPSKPTAQPKRNLERLKTQSRALGRPAAKFQLAALFVRRRLARSRRCLLCVVPLAASLVATSAAVAADPACNAQCADQITLLAPFNSLWNPSGSQDPLDAAVLAANLQEEVDIYLGATKAQKAAAATILVIPDISANLLIRAFPDNPNFYYDRTGWPHAPALPESVAKAVSDVEEQQPDQRDEADVRRSQRLRPRILHDVAGTNRHPWQSAAVSGVERRSWTIRSRQPTRPFSPTRTSRRPASTK